MFGIFGKKSDPPPRKGANITSANPAANITPNNQLGSNNSSSTPTAKAPPAKQFPPQFMQQQTHNNKQSTTPNNANSTGRGSASAQRPQNSHQPNISANNTAQRPTPTPVAHSSASVGMFDDMFGGLSLKTPTTAAQVSVPAPAPIAPAADDDMFVGMTTAADDSTGTSLLSMISSSDAHEANRSEASGFEFISDNSAGEANSEQSSFAFLAESSPTIDMGRNSVSGSASRNSISLDGLTVNTSGPVISNHSAAPSNLAARSSVTVPVITSPTTDNSNTLESTRQTIESALEEFWRNIRTLNDQQAQLRLIELQLTTTIRDNSAKLKQCETAQTAAVEAEEYERADALNAEMESLKQSIGNSTRQLLQTSESIQQRDSDKQNSTNKLLKIVAGSTERFESLKKTHLDDMNSYISSQQSKLEKQEDELNGNFDRIERILLHNSTDLNKVEEETNEIEQQIVVDTKDVAAEKDKYEQQQIQLEIELEELRNQLKNKENQIRECISKQEAAKQSIQNTRAIHERKLKRIAEKRAIILREKATNEAENNKFKASKEQLEAEFVAVKQKELKFKQILQEILQDLAQINNIQHRIEKQQSKRKAWLEQYQTQLKQLDSYNSELSTINSSLESSRAALLRVESTAADHHNNLTSINQKIPSLETEKNLAVAARDFKKAAAASKDIKSLQQSKSESETALEELKLEVARENSAIEAQERSREEIVNRITAAEDDLDLRRLIHLLQLNARLASRQRRIEAALAQNVEQNKRSAGHIGTELAAIEVELKWNEDEVRQLKGKHSWDENFVQKQRQKAEETGQNDSDDEEDSSAPVQNHLNEPSAFDNRRKQTSQAKAAVEIENNHQDNSSTQDIVELLSPTSESPAPESPAAVITTNTNDIATPTNNLNQSAGALPSSTQFSQPEFSEIDLLSAKQELAAASENLKDLENKLEAAIAGEEFEQAAELEDSITVVKQTLDKAQKQVNNIESVLNSNIPESAAATDATTIGSSSDAGDSLLSQLNADDENSVNNALNSTEQKDNDAASEEITL
jgi:chromosome segregation ATPase